MCRYAVFLTYLTIITTWQLVQSDEHAFEDDHIKENEHETDAVPVEHAREPVLEVVPPPPPIEEEYGDIDVEHLEKEMEEVDKDYITHMSKEEKEFAHFTAHDENQDQLIDGLEVIKHIQHKSEKYLDEAHFANTEKYVDDFLHELDKNGDGYVSYPEYKKFAKFKEEHPLHHVVNVEL